VIKSAIGIETEGYTHQAVFSYPKKGGIEALIRAIALPIKEKIHTGFPISSIREKDRMFIISDGTNKVTADRCISTIPLQELLRCLDGVPERVQLSCDKLKYNSLACVFIGIKGKVPDISWLYVHEKDLGLFNRVSFPSNYSPEVVPPGHSSILVEITYHDGGQISTMSDREIINHTVAALRNMNIIKTHNEVVYTALERQKYAYVIYDLDYLRNIAIVKDFCMKRSIMLVGRFAEFEYLNMDGCIRNALNFTRNR
jgi:protoporphyrinogen oxidase